MSRWLILAIIVLVSLSLMFLFIGLSIGELIIDFQEYQQLLGVFDGA